MAENIRQLLTVITESRLESLLLQDLEKLGARGYTVTDARGKGSRGVREGDWSPSQNIRVEIICDAALAKEITRHLRETYYDDYAMIMFQLDVAVLRPNKFDR